MNLPSSATRRMGLGVLLILAAARGNFAAHAQEDKAPPQSLRILTTIYPLQIMALNITKDVPGVQVTNMAPPTAGCLHNYNLTPNDLKALANAEILIVNGGGMESFLEAACKLIPKERTIVATAGMDLIQERGEPNPHVWVSPSGAIGEVRAIAEGLALIDPDNAEAYKRNAGIYIAKIEDLRARMKASLEEFKGRSIVTFHEAFPYFAGEFDLSVVAVISQDHGAAPSPRALTLIMEAMRKAGSKLIFIEPQYPGDVARLLAGETGAKIFVLDPAATGPINENAYLDIMENNLRTLRGAMQ